MSADPRAMARRATYRPSLMSADYLVVRRVQEFVDAQLRALIKPGSRVLDIGCGEQPLRAAIESLGGAYSGIDVVQNGPGTVDIIAPIEKVPLPDGAADVIVITEVLEHVADSDGAFRELARLLRSGGRVIVTTPFAYPLHEEPHDYNRLTPSAIEWLAARHGLQVATLATGGNELEAMAVIWMNLWERMPRGAWMPLRKAFTACRIAMNAFTNAITLPLSRLANDAMPRRTYVSLLAVLAKP